MHEIHHKKKQAAERIAQLRAKRLEIDIELKGLEAQHAALSRLLASPDEEPLSVTERVARFVESQDQPVGVAQIAGHLRGEGVEFNEKSISVYLSRLAADGRLRTVARGRYVGLRDG